MGDILWEHLEILQKGWYECWRERIVPELSSYEPHSPKIKMGGTNSSNVLYNLYFSFMLCMCSCSPSHTQPHSFFFFSEIIKPAERR
jgi:hypothetical protein